MSTLLTKSACLCSRWHHHFPLQCHIAVALSTCLELLSSWGVKATEQLSNLLLFSRQEKRRFSFPNLLMQKVLCMNVGGE